MDALLLSRLQFVWVIAWHILLPAFTVGLACYIATLEVLWWWKKDDVYRRLSAYWIKIFAVSFGMGVVSGIVMPFQFGTNWSRFSDAAASVIGSLMAYEVLTAFYLEAAFLGVLLFGRKLVPQWAHVFSALMVAFGTLMSSFWILAVNSWMQTPQGHVVVDGRFEPVSMLAVLFTPSFPYRLSHTVIAFLVTSGFVILAVAAGFLRQRRHVEESRVMVKMSLAFLSIMVPLQIVVGDLHGLNTLKHQPAKVAAMEGLWETERGAGLRLFAWPDATTRSNHFELKVPGLASFILTHHWDGEVRGLNSFEHHPPVAPLFWGFRVMVGVGLLMLAVSWLGVWHTRRGREPAPWLSRVLVGMTFAGWVATLSGWYVTEIGRQPWLVYGTLKTADAASSVSAPMIGLSLGLYLTLYVVLLLAYISVLFHLMHKAMHAGDQQPATALPGAVA